MNYTCILFLYVTPDIKCTYYGFPTYTFLTLFLICALLINLDLVDCFPSTTNSVYICTFFPTVCKFTWACHPVRMYMLLIILQTILYNCSHYFYFLRFCRRIECSATHYHCKSTSSRLRSLSSLWVCPVPPFGTTHLLAPSRKTCTCVLWSGSWSVEWSVAGSE